MAAFAYVYEIFTATQLQFAVTKSNKNLPNKPVAAFVSKVLYILYKVFMRACYFYWRKCIFQNLSPLLRTDRSFHYNPDTKKRLFLNQKFQTDRDFGK